MAKSSLTYKETGVSLAANTRWIDAIAQACSSTYGPRVLNRPNGFAGMYRLGQDEPLFQRNLKQPVLVACADGVGTKLLLALRANKLSGLGIDLVAMNVNDLITCGAEPLFFLDYLAVSDLDPQRLGEIIQGIAAGCRQAGCVLLGGETAEMPDLYRKGQFDLAGFCVGVVEFGLAIDGSRIRKGDDIIALPSSGIHSNGYTLVRKLIAKGRCRLDRSYEELGGTLSDVLLKPTRIYVQAVRAVLSAYPKRSVITGMAHVTGGGIRENLARVLPKNCNAVISKRAWRVPPVFDFLRRLGTTRAEMFKVFNMGLGYVFFVRPRFVGGVIKVLQQAGEDPIRIGKVEPGAARTIMR